MMREAFLAWLRNPVAKGSEAGVDWAECYADSIEEFEWLDPTIIAGDGKGGVDG